jgi:phosphoribosylaminoimidazole-succinocarboxamide synthase
MITKKIYEGESDDQLIQLFTDYIPIRNGNKKDKIRGKAVLNNAMSSLLFEYLESYHVMTHFVSKLSEKEMLVKKIEILPFVVTVSNVATNALCKRYGFENGADLENPITEIYLEDDKSKNSMVNDSHLLALNIANNDEVFSVHRTIQKVNAVLKSFFDRRNVKLIQFNLRFGRHKGHMVICDEVTPDTCRLWDALTSERIDPDGNYLKIEKIEKYYKKIHDRILGD